MRLRPYLLILGAAGLAAVASEFGRREQARRVHVRTQRQMVIPAAAARPTTSALSEETLRAHRKLVVERRSAADDLFSMGLPEDDPTGPADVTMLRWALPYRHDMTRSLLDALHSRITWDERCVLEEKDRVSVVRLHAHATSEGPEPVTVLWFWTDDDRNMRIALSARDLALLSAGGVRVAPSAARYDFCEAAQ